MSTLAYFTALSNEDLEEAVEELIEIGATDDLSVIKRLKVIQEDLEALLDFGPLAAFELACRLTKEEAAKRWLVERKRLRAEMAPYIELQNKLHAFAKEVLNRQA